jgi:hypothetical protein
MKKFLSFAAVAALTLAAHATVLTVAEGTNEAQYVPFYGFQMDTKGSISQVIYPADLLADMQGGTISEIKFYPTEAFGNLGAGNLQISLKEVEQDRFSDTEIVTGATVVANAYPVQGSTEWIITLDQPFEYNGGNLLIETNLTTEGSFKSTKFFGLAFDYAVGLAQYSYAWSTSSYYETENVLPKASFTYEAGETPQPQAVRGDVDGNQACDMDDLSLLINYLLNDSTPINEAGAAICDSLTSTTVDMDDLSAMINYLLTGVWAE